MFPGSPAPLPPSTRLSTVIHLMRPGTASGVWLRGSDRLRLLHLAGARRLLLSRDLGLLLRRCQRIAVRHGGRVDQLSASQLVRCRVLEIVLGTPYLPPPAQLRELFPEIAERCRGYAVPIGLGSAEEALAICAAERVPVRSSRITYGHISG
jgi:hypothetical protein